MSQNDIFTNLVQDMEKRRYVTKKSRTELLKMNENDMLMELIRDIAIERDMDILCFKILQNVGLLTRCDRASMFLTRGTKENPYLVSKLFDVTENSTLEQCLKTDANNIKVPYGIGFCGTVAQTKEPINIPDAYEVDPRFKKDMDKKTGYTTKAILCMPILNYDEEVIGVAQIINKTDGSDSFTNENQSLFKTYLTFCGICMTNTQMYKSTIEKEEQNKLLMTLAKGLSKKQTSLDKLIMQIMLDAQHLIKCMRCNVYLFNEKEGTATKGFEMNSDNPENIIILGAEDIAKSKSVGFAKLVAVSGQPDMIADSVADPRFSKEIIEYDGFHIKSLITVPMKNSEGQVIGVVQMINRPSGEAFSSTDMSTIETFSIFCGLGIHDCQLYENLSKLVAKQKISYGVMLYRAKPKPDEVEKLSKAIINKADDYKLHNFMFVDSDLDDYTICKIVIRMLIDMQFVQKFHIPYEMLCMWTLTIRNTYRPVEIHNWRHAVSSTQALYVFLMTGNFGKHFDDIEKFGLMIACLCHDLDHQDVDNFALAQSDSPHNAIHNSSMLQRYNLEQFMMILSDKDVNILHALSAEDHKRVTDIAEDAILATDVAVLIKKLEEFVSLLRSGERISWANPANKELLYTMLMGAADMSSVFKPWYWQTDINHLSLEYIAVKNKEIPDVGEAHKPAAFAQMHVEYLNDVCIPLFQHLMKVERSAIHPLLKSINYNMKKWKIQARSSPSDTATETKTVKESKAKQNVVKTTSEEDLSNPIAQTRALEELDRTYQASRGIIINTAYTRALEEIDHTCPTSHGISINSSATSTILQPTEQTETTRGHCTIL